MSNTAISASNQTSLAAVYGAARGSRRHGGHGDKSSSGDNQEQGVNVLASLVQALTQAAGTQAPATTTAAAGTTSTAVTTATAGTTATPGTTATSSTSATSAASATGASGGTSGSSLVQDLQAFLHDLVHALRQASRSNQGSGSSPTTTGSAAATSTPVTANSTAATSSATPAASSTAAASTPAASSTTAAANTGAAAYGQSGIIAALQSLVKDLASSQEVTNTDSSSGLSPNTLSNLNTAFQKLISDLNGSASSTAGTSSGSTADSSESTAALQSFLTNFVQDLQNNGSNSPSYLGSSVNTTA